MHEKRTQAAAGTDVSLKAFHRHLLTDFAGVKRSPRKTHNG